MPEQLTRDQWYQLDEQYARTPHPSDTFAASGEHYRLTALLNKFGYHPMSRDEAMRIAERLLSDGWKD